VLGAHDIFLRKRKEGGVRCEAEKEGGAGGPPPDNDLDATHGVTTGQWWRWAVRGREREALPGGPGQAPCE
jgi:hypothetical protein